MKIFGLILALFLSMSSLSLNAEAATPPTITPGATISAQNIVDSLSPLSYEMDNNNNMSWMRVSQVPVESVKIADTATLAASDITTNHYVYRVDNDASTYDLPKNPDHMSSYHYIQGAQYVTAHGDMNLVASQTIGLVCFSAATNNAKVVFQKFISGAVHTWEAWISGSELESLQFKSQTSC